MAGKILKLHIEAFKGIKDVNIDWEDDYNILALIGDGGLGKSSVTEFVEACLTGIVDEEAINLELGKAKGNIDLLLNNKKYNISIAKTKKSETVKIYGEDKMSGGKEAIRDLIGKVAINPFEICKKDTGEQIEYFQKMFNIDAKVLQGEYQTVYDERAAINRQVNKIGQYLLENGVDEKFGETLAKYKEPKELGDREERLTLAKQTNQQITDAHGNVDTLSTEIKTLDQDILDYEEQIRQIQVRIDAKKERKTTCEGIIEEKNKFILATPVVDIAVLQQEIQEINEYTITRNSLTAIVLKIKELDDAKLESKEKTEALKKKLKEIDDYIVSCTPKLETIKMYQVTKDPETGAVTEAREGIYWNEKPIRILSTTEKIAFGIEFQKAVNPTGLTMLVIDDFESCGTVARKEIVTMVKELGYKAIVAEMNLDEPTLKVVLKHDIVKSDTDKEVDVKKKG